MKLVIMAEGLPYMQKNGQRIKGGKIGQATSPKPDRPNLMAGITKHIERRERPDPEPKGSIVIAA